MQSYDSVGTGEGKMPENSASKKGGADESAAGGWTSSDFSSSPLKFDPVGSIRFDPVAALDALTPGQLLDLFGSPEKEPAALELRSLPEVPVRASSAPSAAVCSDPSAEAPMCRTRSFSLGDRRGATVQIRK